VQDQTQRLWPSLGKINPSKSTGLKLISNMEKSKFDIELPQEIINALARHVISEIRRQRVLEDRQTEKDVEDNIHESKSETNIL